MADLTPIISSTLVERKSTPLGEGAAPRISPEPFIQEAYRIHSHISNLLTYLRQIRHPYLSTAPPPRAARRASSSKRTSSLSISSHTHLTDAQRDSIDSETATLLRDLTSSINSLRTTESTRHQARTAVLQKKYGRSTGRLWRWAAGDEDPSSDAGKTTEQLQEEGEAETKKSVREGVIWYLGHELQQAADMQRGMVEKRVEREREKEKSILYKMSAAGGKVPTSPSRADMGSQSLESSTSSLNPHNNMNGPLSTAPDYGNINLRGYNPAAEDDEKSIESQLTPAQLQLFASENNTMLRHYESTLSKIQHAEKSLLEVSSLQQTLVEHLATQGELIEQLVTDASRTDENVRGGNRELKKAAERSSTARMVFWGTVGLCSTLVVWDMIF